MPHTTAADLNTALASSASVFKTWRAVLAWSRAEIITKGLINTLLMPDTETLDLYAENMVDAAIQTLQSAPSLRRKDKC
jgi:hypothetical protein